MGKTQEVKKNKPKARFKVGQIVWAEINRAGIVSYEKHRVKVYKGSVYVCLNGAGNDPFGPFDVVSGNYIGDLSLKSIIKLLRKRPAGYKPKPRFKAGQTVWITLSGRGIAVYEEKKVKCVRQGKVWLGNEPRENEPDDGPFDAVTGDYLSKHPRYSRRIVCDKPKGRFKPAK